MASGRPAIETASSPFRAILSFVDRAVADPETAGSGPRQPAPRQPGRRLRWLGGRALLGAVATGVMSVALMQYFSQGLPSVQFLREGGYNPPQVSRILSAQGTLLASEFLQRRTVVAFDDIPDVTKLAFLAAEDAYFYEHGGVSWRSIARAAWVDLRAGAIVQGASTISQQVAEDVLLGHSRSFSQKPREWLLAYRLEHQLSKNEILGLYLNNIYLGHGRYGVDEAARFYFGKRAAELDATESALLAGINANPERYSPRRAPERALRRRAFVLGQMRDKGFITPEDYAASLATPLHLAPLPEELASLAPEVVPPARRLLQQARQEQNTQGGYNVQTTIDARLQLAGRQAVQAALRGYADRHALWPPFTRPRVPAWGPPLTGMPAPNRIGVGIVDAADDASGTLRVKLGEVVGEVKLADEQRYNPQQLAASAFAQPGAVLRVALLEPPPADRPARLRLELGPQAALAAVDVRTREVRALIGGAEGSPGGFDRSTRAQRQPGSAFKPIVYSAALHAHEVSPATVLELDKAGPGTSLLPPFRVSVRSALAHSNNDAAVELLHLAGPERTIDWARQLGISSKLGADDSLALGSYEVTPLELANAYATFASGGMFQPPILITEVESELRGAYPLSPRPEPQRAMSREEAYLMTSLLQAVVEQGTGAAAQRLGRPIAAKTGTTNQNKDAWFVGYSTELSVAVWIGYDDALPLGPGSSESGAKTAGPAFVDFMRAAHEGRPVSEFPRPNEIVTMYIDPTTGLLPWPGQTDAVMEEFLDGTEPVQTAFAPAVANALPRD